MSDLTEFARIEEVDTFVVDYEEVNKHLQVGWRLFATRTEAHDEPEGQTQSTVYCLGWPDELGTPIVGFEEIEAEIKRKVAEMKREEEKASAVIEALKEDMK